MYTRISIVKDFAYMAWQIAQRYEYVCVNFIICKKRNARNRVLCITAFVVVLKRTIRSKNGYNIIRAKTVDSDKGSLISRVITINARSFLHGAEALRSNTK
jgi:hypothetical protein